MPTPEFPSTMDIHLSGDPEQGYTAVGAIGFNLEVYEWCQTFEAHGDTPRDALLALLDEVISSES